MFTTELTWACLSEPAEVQAFRLAYMECSLLRCLSLCVWACRFDSAGLEVGMCVNSNSLRGRGNHQHPSESGNLAVWDRKTMAKSNHATQRPCVNLSGSLWPFISPATSGKMDMGVSYLEHMCSAYECMALKRNSSLVVNETANSYAPAIVVEYGVPQVAYGQLPLSHLVL